MWNTFWGENDFFFNSKTVKYLWRSKGQRSSLRVIEMGWYWRVDNEIQYEDSYRFWVTVAFLYHIETDSYHWADTWFSSISLYLWLGSWEGINLSVNLILRWGGEATRTIAWWGNEMIRLKSAQHGFN